MLIAGEAISSSSIVRITNIADSCTTEMKFGMGWHETDLLPETLTRQLIVCFKIFSTAPYERKLTASKDLLAIDTRLQCRHHPRKGVHLSPILAGISNQENAHCIQNHHFYARRFWSVGSLECLDTLHPYRQSLATEFPRTLCEERDTMAHQRRCVSHH